MFETLKRAASATWSAVKYVAEPIGSAVKYVAAPILSYVAAPIVIIARAASSAGQVVFSIRKFLKYITGLPNHAATLPLVGMAVFVNLLTFFPTRAPLLWRFFRVAKTNVHPVLIQAENEPASGGPLAVTEDTERGEIIIRMPPEIAEELRPLGKTGKMLYLLGLIFAWSSTSLITLNSYLFNVSFMNFILKLMGDNMFDALKTESEDDPDWDDNIKIGVQALSALFVLANLLGNITYNQLKNRQKAREFAEHVENGDLPLDRYTGAALLVGGPAVISAFFVGMFSTESSLEKLPYIVLPEIAKKVISIYSGSTALVYNAMTGLPAVRSAFMREKNNLRIEPACWEKPLKIAVGVTGFADTITTSISTFTSFANTMGDVTHTDPKHLGIIISGAVVGGSAFANNYQFSVLSAMDYVLELHHRDRDNMIAYQSVPQIDVEEENSSEPQRETTEAIAIGSSRFSLFSGEELRTASARTPRRSLEEDSRGTLAFGMSV